MNVNFDSNNLKLRFRRPLDKEENQTPDDSSKRARLAVPVPTIPVPTEVLGSETRLDSKAVVLDPQAHLPLSPVKHAAAQISSAQQIILPSTPSPTQQLSSTRITDWLTQSNLGLLYYTNKNWAEAERYFQHALQLSRDNQEKFICQLRLGWIALYQHQYPKAENCFNEAMIQATSNYQKFYATMGLAEADFKTFQFGRAKNRIEEVLRLKKLALRSITEANKKLDEIIAAEAAEAAEVLSGLTAQ